MSTQVTARATLLRANNPSPMTLDGTNTWIVREPGDERAVVIDPGPDDERHLGAVRAAVAGSGAHVDLVLLTHRHADHTGGATRFAAWCGAPIRAMDVTWCSHAQPLADGERLPAHGLEVIATPGHTGDSICLLLAADNALLTGDTVLGRGSTVLAPPDGNLADYLASLRRLRRLVDDRQLRVVLPGHGPTVDAPAELIEGYLAHRAQRLDQVRAAIAAGAADAEAVAVQVYAEVGVGLSKPARWSLGVQLDYLRDRGEPAPDVPPTWREL